MTTIAFPRHIDRSWKLTRTKSRRSVSLDDLTGLITTAGGERETRTIRTPFTGEALGEVPISTEEDVRFAVEKARLAQRYWARRSFRERQEIFLRYHDLVLAHQEQLMDLVQLEGGKARRDAMEEVFDVAIISHYYAANAEAFLKPKKRKGVFPLATSTWEYHHPVGVVGIFAPWNYPLTLAISDAIPALMAGNAIVFKPASETPFTGLYAVQLLREAGLPPELYQIVTGRGSQISSALMPQVDFFHFTGSTSTGRIVAKQAAEQLIPFSMELGGKNPFIVMKDADLDWAADELIRGSFSNAGQLCVAFERVYVHNSVYELFLERLIPKVQALRLGGALDYSMDVGTLISQDQLDKVQEHVQDALDKGARLLAGGKHRPGLGPYFYEPTVLANVTPEMKVYAEETFGPVISLYRFDSEEEAIRRANETEYGLNAAIWTRDIENGRRMAQRIQAGTVNINDSYAAAWGSVDAPMGGMKDSGIGRRHGREGILKYTESQNVAAQRVLRTAPSGWLKPRYFALAITLYLLVLKRTTRLR